MFSCTFHAWFTIFLYLPHFSTSLNVSLLSPRPSHTILVFLQQKIRVSSRMVNAAVRCLGGFDIRKSRFGFRARVSVCRGPRVCQWSLAEHSKPVCVLNRNFRGFREIPGALPVTSCVIPPVIYWGVFLRCPFAVSKCIIDLIELFCRGKNIVWNGIMRNITSCMGKAFESSRRLPWKFPKWYKCHLSNACKL